jgi:hypothetical protein
VHILGGNCLSLTLFVTEDYISESLLVLLLIFTVSLLIVLHTVVKIINKSIIFLEMKQDFGVTKYETAARCATLS